MAKVIPNAINPDFIFNEEGAGSKKKVLLAAGRLNEQKNYKLLIDAFDIVSRRYPEYILKIFGKGPLENELKQYAESKKCSQHIRFCGYVDNMPEQLKQAQIYILSSNYEGMPNALMEAMAMGLPCISTNCPCGGPGFLIKDHENGLLVPVNDVIGMSDAIIELIENVELRSTLGINAKRIVKILDPTIIYEEWKKCVLGS